MNTSSCHEMIDDLLEFVRADSGLVEGSDESFRYNLIQFRLIKIRQEAVCLEDELSKTRLSLEAEIQARHEEGKRYRSALTGMSRKHDAVAGIYPRAVPDPHENKINAEKEPKRPKRKLRIVK